MTLSIFENGGTKRFWPKDDNERQKIIDEHAKGVIVGENTNKVLGCKTIGLWSKPLK